MFDLITGRAKHLPHHPALPLMFSTTVQAMVIAAVVAVPLLFVTDQIPEVPTMMAFVVAPPAPPPPPPPPAPVRSKPATPASRPAPAASHPIPLEAPLTIEPEAFDDEGFDEGAEYGVEGGVEGGIPDGVVGGILGGLPEPPPPPPPAPMPRAPVRVGGQIHTPALLHRVEPIYPAIAVNAHIQGIVILEAIVDEDGTVAEVKVLRSANPVLNGAALAAVRQWRYSPLTLNGIRTRFILTAVLSFHLEDPKE
jgi:protein TonB